MKIRTRFLLTVAVFSAILVVMTVSLLLTNRRVEKIQKQEQIAYDIALAARELSYLTNDFLLHGESHQRERWKAKFLSFSDLMSGLTPEGPEYRMLMDELKINLRWLQSIFNDVSSTFEKRLSNNEGAAELAMIRVSWSRMEVQNQGLAFNASRLAIMLGEKADRLRHLRIILLFLLVGIFGLFLVINYWVVNLRILRGISELRAGTEIVGSGDLDFAFEEKRSDEIGDLSRAFNRMTASLKVVTASKAHLEREMAERERVEMELRKNKDRLAASLDEKKILLKEIHHRVKNNMQVISSLVSLQAEDLQDEIMQDVMRDVTHRVRSMALVHEKLYQSEDLARVNFAEYAQSLLDYLWRAHGAAASGIRLALDVKSVPLSVTAAAPCGLLLNELVGNALKHAFPDGAGGQIFISFQSLEQGLLRLRVRDNGKGMPEGFDWTQTRSLGLRLVRMLARQLHASVEVSGNGGTEFTIVFKAVGK